MSVKEDDKEGHTRQGKRKLCRKVWKEEGRKEEGEKGRRMLI